MALSAFTEVNQVNGARTYYVDSITDLPTGSTVHSGDIALDISPAAGVTSSWIYDGSHWVGRGVTPTYNAANADAPLMQQCARVGYTLTYIKSVAVNKVATAPVLTLPAKAVITAIRVKQSAALAGGGESACTAQLGITGTIAAFMTAVDVFTAAGDTVFYNTLAAQAVSAAATPMILTLTTTTNNVSALTTGALDVWVNYVVLP